MPWVSEAQRAFGNSPEGLAKIGAAKVAEFNAATAGHALPKRSNKTRRKIAAIRAKARTGRMT